MSERSLSWTGSKLGDPCRRLGYARISAVLESPPAVRLGVKLSKTASPVSRHDRAILTADLNSYAWQLVYQ